MISSARSLHFLFELVNYCSSSLLVLQLLRPRLRLNDSLADVETSLTFDFGERGAVNCLHARKTEIIFETELMEQCFYMLCN